MNIVEFAHYYKNLDYPHDPALMKRVIVTDVSTSTLVWDEGEFLVELYMIHPNKVIERHSHPFENLVIHFSGVLTGTRENSSSGPVTLTDNDHGKIGSPLPPYQWHEFTSGSMGCVLYNISRWDDISQKESATIRYIGNPLGPVHQNFLKTL
jgi:hypothetical protein